MSDERRAKAKTLLDQVTEAMFNPPADLTPVLRRFQLAAELLQLPEYSGWAAQEISGYGTEVPPSRTANAVESWQPMNPDDQLTASALSLTSSPNYPEPPAAVKSSVWASAADIGRQLESGYTQRLDNAPEVASIGTQSFKRVKVSAISSVSLKIVHSAIAQQLFEYSVRIGIDIEYGDAVSDVFARYRDEVEPAIAEHGLETEIATFTRNLEAGDTPSLQAACLAGRNILIRLSDDLLPDDVTTHPVLKSGDGSPMSVSKQHFKNRLRAYLWEKGQISDELVHSQLQWLASTLDGLNDSLSSGKRGVTVEDVEAAAVQLYAFIGQLVRLTDMQPLESFERR